MKSSNKILNEKDRLVVNGDSLKSTIYLAAINTIVSRLQSMEKEIILGQDKLKNIEMYADGDIDWLCYDIVEDISKKIGVSASIKDSRLVSTLRESYKELAFDIHLDNISG